MAVLNNLLLNFTLTLLPLWSISGVRLLSEVAQGVIVLSDRPLDFHGKIYFLFTQKDLIIGWNIK